MSRALRIVVVAAIVLAVLGVAALAPLPFSVTHRVANAIDIAAPPERVYDYVTTPAHWPRWHPSSLAVEGAAASHSMTLDERVTEEFSVAGRHGRAEWRVIERDAPRLWAIEGSIAGRRAGVVRYRVAPTPRGARFEREFEYVIPTALFWVLEPVLIRPRIADESARAVAQLRAVLEGAAPAR